MKNKALYGILLLMLAVALTAGLSLYAWAAEPTAMWSNTTFGRAEWSQVAGTNVKYTVTLKKFDDVEDDYVTVKQISDLSVLNYDFVADGTISEAEGKQGIYKFFVQSNVEGAAEAESPEKPFYKLDAPRSAFWTVSTTSVLAECKPYSTNNTSIGIPSQDKLVYHFTVINVTTGRTIKNQTQTGSEADLENTTSTVTIPVTTLLKPLTGTFKLKVYITCDGYAFPSDPIESDELVYPPVMSKPGSAQWGTGSNAGIVNWAPVSGADGGYEVTFYWAEPQMTKVYVDLSGTIREKTYKDAAGNSPVQKDMLYQYKFKKLYSKTVPKDDGTGTSCVCDISTLGMKTSGLYFFTVVAKGLNNTNSSEPLGCTNFSTGEVIYSYDYTTDGSYKYKDNQSQYEVMLNRVKSAVDSSYYFDFVSTSDILYDFDLDGLPDPDESGHSIYLPINGSITISALRRCILDAPDATVTLATETPFIWEPLQNKNCVSIENNGDDAVITGLAAGNVRMKVYSKLSSYLGTEFMVYVTVPPTSIVISGNNSLLEGGASTQLKVTVGPEDAKYDPAFFSWTSNPDSIVSVDSLGRITPTVSLPATPSYADIYCKSLVSGVVGSFRVYVSRNGIMPAKIAIEGASTVPLKSTLQLTASVYSDTEGLADQEFATNKEVTWTTSDANTATVDQNGKVTPKALGRCTITATSKETRVDVKATKEILVVPEEINITKLTLSSVKAITVGDSVDIKLTITPTNATDRDVVWSVTGGGRLTYKSELVRTLTATSEGTATVKVYSSTSNSIKAEVVVTVNTASKTPETDVGKTEIITDIKPVAGTGDKKNEYTAAINEAVLNEAITKVFKEAIPIKTTPVVRIKVATPTSAVDCVIKIPYDSVYKIINYWGYKDKGILVVETGIGTVTISPFALRSIYGQANSNSDIQLKMTKVDNANLTEAQQKAADGRKVTEFRILSGGKEINRFGGYAITVGLPFTISSTQSGKGVQVDYLNENGYLSSLSTEYDYKAKVINFDTNHFSMYIPYYYAAVAWDNPYEDVRLSDWYYDSVFYVCDRGLMRGISAERFVPASYTTRAMVVTILHRLAGAPAAKEANPFVDVFENQWYTEAVLWATEEGLVNGYGGGKFGPNDQVTREQLGVMLHNYAKYVDITPQYGWDTPMKYPDSANVASWARQGAMYCQITGIISGRAGGRFDPKGVATRCELATMLLRMNKQMEEQVANTTTKT